MKLLVILKIIRLIHEWRSGKMMRIHRFSDLP